VNHSLYASFEAFTAVLFQVDVIWVETPCSVVVGYQRFRGQCCLHLQPTGSHNPEDLRMNHSLYFNQSVA